MQGGNKFLISNFYIFVARVVDEATQDVVLMVSPTYKDVYDFKKVDMPMQRLR